MSSPSDDLKGHRHNNRSRRGNAVPAMTMLPAVLWALVLLTPARATATDGKFFIGLDFLTNHIGADDPQTGDPPGTIYVEESGGGVGLHLGFSLTDKFKLRLYGSGARHETTAADVELRLTGATLEALYMFSPASVMRPYLHGGLGGYVVESEQDAFSYKTDGPGVVFGAGFYYFLGRHFALDFSLRGEWINWETASAELVLPGGHRVTTETPVEESGFAGKFTLGGSVWF